MHPNRLTYNTLFKIFHSICFAAVKSSKSLKAKSQIDTPVWIPQFENRHQPLCYQILQFFLNEKLHTKNKNKCFALEIKKSMFTVLLDGGEVWYHLKRTTNHDAMKEPRIGLNMKISSWTLRPLHNTLLETMEPVCLKRGMQNIIASSTNYCN